MKKYLSLPYDFLGITAASLCMLHCLLFPLLTILPLGLSDEAWIDTVFAGIACVVVYKILNSDASKLIKTILTVSLSTVIISVVLNLLFGIHNGLIFFGGIGMIIGHLLNFKLNYKSFKR